MTVEEVIEKIESIKSLIDFLDKANFDGLHLRIEDAEELSDHLDDYRSMLLAMKVK